MERDMTRRDFLGRAVVAGASVVLPVAAMGRALAQEPSLGPEVVSVEGDPAEAVRAAILALGGIEAFVKPGHQVTVKPNMSFANPPEMATTTHPDVVRTVVELCLSAGASRVLVMDHTLRDPTSCKERSGLEAALRGMPRVALLTLNRQHDFFTEVAVPRGVQLKETEVAKEVLRSDVLIAVPVAKSHSAGEVSLGLKGMMGLIWDRGVFHSKHDLHQAIADLSTVLRADLTVIDASRALITRGPGGPGRVARLNRVVASRDPVAADAYAVGLTPWYNRTVRGTQIAHIARAAELGVGQADVSKMRIRQITA